MREKFGIEGATVPFWSWSPILALTPSRVYGVPQDLHQAQLLRRAGAAWKDVLAWFCCMPCAMCQVNYTCVCLKTYRAFVALTRLSFTVAATLYQGAGAVSRSPVECAAWQMLS